MRIDLPLEIYYTKNRKFRLNLNQYRNAHYYTLNNAKKTFQNQLIQELKKYKKFNKKVDLTYTLYPKTKRLVDTNNVLTIVDKFFQDAMVEAEILEDDNWKFVNTTTFKFGGKDKDKPRVEVEVKET